MSSSFISVYVKTPADLCQNQPLSHTTNAERMTKRR